MTNDVRVVLVTVPQPGGEGTPVGANLARSLVAEGLCACVNRVPGVMSTFLWEGDVQEEGEELLVIKTTQGRLAALTERVVDLHPYEVPEVLALPVETGLDAYLDWVKASCKA